MISVIIIISSFMEDEMLKYFLEWFWFIFQIPKLPE